MTDNIKAIMQKVSPKRVLLKVSGEALMGNQSYGIDIDTVQAISKDIMSVSESGYEVCVVIGGGNIFRGLAGASQGMDRAGADYMGMLATVMNALGVQNALEKLGAQSRVMSAIDMPGICEPYIRRRAIRHLEKGRIVIFAAGTGNPFFTTDTAAVLRAIETGCDILLKGTQVDGVYNADPKVNPNAQHYDLVDYTTVVQKELRVMDLTAITLSGDNNLPIIVFNISEPDGFKSVLSAKGKFTLVCRDITV